jgi:hypothetical protein
MVLLLFEILSSISIDKRRKMVVVNRKEEVARNR